MPTPEHQGGRDPTVTTAGRVYCAECGAGARSGDLFCTACGHQLRQPDAAPDNRTRGTEDAATAALQRAHRFLVTGKIAEATPLLEQLSIEQPQWAAVRGYLGVAYLRAARVIEAQEMIEEALRRAPDDFTCRMAHAEFFARLGFYDKAVPELDTALGLATPGADDYRAAFELRRFCQEKSKGLFYRPTVLPRIPLALRRWRQRGRVEATSTIQTRSS